MHHLDNGHLPEPDEHFVDVSVSRLRTISVLSFMVGVEAAGLGAMAFGVIFVGRRLLT